MQILPRRADSRKDFDPMGEGSIVSELLLERLNYCIYVILLMIGLWAMLAKQNLIKKLIGMSIFQTAIILFLCFHRRKRRGNYSHLPA